MGSKRALYISIALASFLGLLSLFLFFYGNGQQTNTEEAVNTEAENEKITLDYPTIEVGSYSFVEGATASLEPSTEPLRITYRTNFDTKYIQNLATQLGMQDPQRDDLQDMVVLRDPNTLSVLNFDSTNGTFFYYSGDGLIPADSSPDILQHSENFLSEVGLFDDSIACTDWYRTESSEGVTFVECHRQWDSEVGGFGYPILNILGVMNLPADQSLTSLEVGAVDNSILDEDIIATSDNRPGVKRSNGFNTYTVAVLNDGTVTAVTSTMRPLEQVVVQPTTSFKTVDEAKQELLARKSVTLTRPSGDGPVDLTKVYTENRAAAENVEVSEYILAYLEEPLTEPQKDLPLAYIFKGTARIQSGYDVDFIDIVPAIKSEVSFNSSNAVLGISSLSGGSLCGLGGSLSFCSFSTDPFDPCPNGDCQNPPTPTPFIPTVTPFIPTVTPFIPTVTSPPTSTPVVTATNTPAPTVTRVPTETRATSTPRPPTPTRKVVTPRVPTPGDVDECEELDREYVLPSGGKIAYKSGGRNSYYYIPPENQESDLQQLLDRYPQCDIDFGNGTSSSNEKTIYSCIMQEYMIDLNINTGRQLQQMCKPDDASPCAILNPDSVEVCIPVLLISPNIYIQTNFSAQISVGIDLVADVPYRYPNFSGGVEQTWNVMPQPDGSLLHGNRQVDRLYYEYEGGSLLSKLRNMKGTMPGYNVSRENVQSIGSQIADEVRLLEKEKQDFLTELNTVVSTMDTRSENVGVYIVDKSIMNEFVPLHISPKPETIHRLHIYVSPIDKSTKLEQPDLQIFDRSPYTVIETGVIAE